MSYFAKILSTTIALTTHRKQCCIELINIFNIVHPRSILRSSKFEQFSHKKVHATAAVQRIIFAFSSRNAVSSTKSAFLAVRVYGVSISRFWLKIICINLCLEIFEEISLHRLQNFDQNFIFFCKATIKKLTRYEDIRDIYMFFGTQCINLFVFFA